MKRGAKAAYRKVNLISEIVDLLEIADDPILRMKANRLENVPWDLLGLIKEKLAEGAGEKK